MSLPVNHSSPVASALGGDGAQHDASASLDSVTPRSALLVLDATAVTETLGVLVRRIEERFPGAGLAVVAGQLYAVSEDAGRRIAWIRKANLPLRIAMGSVVVLLFALIGKAMTLVRISDDVLKAESFFQTATALIASFVYLGVVIAYLFDAERRLKRSRAVKALHVLRSIAHIIDMHQLTKDPEILLLKDRATPSSPKRQMSAFELSRYLDYCSELLSLTSKVATLYVQDFPDQVAIRVVDQIEDLTTGLSQKVWQKAALLNTYMLEERSMRMRATGDIAAG